MAMFGEEEVCWSPWIRVEVPTQCVDMNCFVLGGSTRLTHVEAASSLVLRRQLRDLLSFLSISQAHGQTIRRQLVKSTGLVTFFPLLSDYSLLPSILQSCHSSSITCLRTVSDASPVFLFL